jgi:twitching motility protein PilT
VDRIIDVFPAGDKEMVRSMIAGSLQAVISQVLLKRVGGGRAAAHEILVGTSAVRNLIRENKVPQIFSMIQVGQRYGMQTMEDSIKSLVERGVVAAEEASSMFAKLSDSGPAPAAAGDGHAKPAHAAPAAQPAQAAAAGGESRKSRSLF